MIQFFLQTVLFFDIFYVFRHEEIDGATAGSNSGGDLTKLYNHLNEWLHSGENWNLFSEFTLEKIKNVGTAQAYSHDNSLLTPEIKKKIIDIIRWTIDEGAIQFKRGDYRVFSQNMLVLKH